STGKFFGFGKRAPPAPIDRRPVSRRESHFMEPTNAGHRGGNGGLLILFCSFTTIPWPGRFFRGKAALDRLIPREQAATRSEEHTSELQSRGHLVCRLLL